MPTTNFSVVVPVYNSHRSLPDLVERLHAIFQQNIRESYEIILVDDCSPQSETWEVLGSLAKSDSHLRIFRLAKNFGQARALLCGMAQAKGDWIITMDDDLQHRPEDIPLLIEHRHHDVVLAKFPEKKCSQFKKLSSNLKGRLDVLLLGKPKHITASPFRLIKKRVINDILTIHTLRPFMIAMILSVTADVVNADVTHDERKFGKSNYTFRKSFSLFSNMLFNNSSFILRAMSGFGFTLSGLSLVYGIYLIIHWYFYSQKPQGWTSLMMVLLLAAGAIIFCLGIIGEYVARLIETAESRPTWTIKESSDSATKGKWSSN